MRHISASLEAKFRSARQTFANNSAPALDLWISRPVVPLVNDYFLEQQAIGSGANVTALDIAVCHPKHRRQSTKIYIATVEGGRAKVISSPFRQAMETHYWTDSGFDEAAEDVALAFDATMKNDTRGRPEFVTDASPWVFWVNDGALYGRILGSDETLTLAETNCTKCTAIRAAGSALGGFDYGLCLFFLLNGEIYVRQRINGEWMDAEPVNFGPDVVWTDIAASRSWDYRVVLQAIASDGTVYELFTQYMGIGQRSVEHIEIKSVEAAGSLTEIGETDTKTTEHIEIAGIDAGALYGGLYSLGQPIMRSAANIPTTVEVDGEQAENYGLRITVRFAAHLNPDSVAENLSAFVMRDSNGTAFAAASAESENGLDWVFTLPDFNNAMGDCTVSYTPGTLYTMAGTVAEGTSVTFTPENLTPSAVEAPKILEVYNV